VANDEDQAGHDLDLAKKIVGINPGLAEDLEILSKEIRRRDGRGTMRSVGSTAGFLVRSKRTFATTDLLGHRRFMLMIVRAIKGN
jgi:hypothetical protein